MNIKKILPVLGIAILGYLIYQIGPSVILGYFAAANNLYLLISLLFFGGFFILQNVKFVLILRNRGIKIKFSDLLKIYLRGWSYGLLTPAKLGTFLKISFLKDSTDESLARITSLVVLDRLIDFFVVFVMALVGSLFLMSHFSGIVPIIALVTIGAAIGLYIFMNESLSRRLLLIVYRHFIPANLKEKAANLFKEFYSSMPKVSEVVLPAFVCLAAWVVIYLQFWFVALALGAEISPIVFVFLVPIGSIVGMIPITMSGLGTREATLMALFSVFAVPASLVFSFSILSFILSLLIAATFLVFDSVFLQKGEE